MRAAALRHRFVGVVPERLEPATLYVSTEFATAVHLCACGCGMEVVTPIGPRDWTLGWNGASVTLDPSVGNARLPCRSHYRVTRGRVDWLRPDPVSDPLPRGRLRAFAGFLRALAGGGRA